MINNFSRLVLYHYLLKNNLLDSELLIDYKNLILSIYNKIKYKELDYFKYSERDDYLTEFEQESNALFYFENSNDFKKIQEKKELSPIITATRKFGNSWINRNKQDLENKLKEYYQSMAAQGNFSKVFLSYAYDDKVYTMALFIYFYSLGIFLSIDWLQNDKILNSYQLKKVLYNELTKCNQLLFLRSPQSEIGAQGNVQVRQWCSWELGVFFRLNRCSNKYLINAYDLEDKNSTLNENNIFLETLNPLKSISHQRLN